MFERLSFVLVEAVRLKRRLIQLFFFVRGTTAWGASSVAATITGGSG